MKSKTLLESTFEFTQVDLTANRKNQISEFQISKMKRLQRMLLTLSFVLLFIFGYFSILIFKWIIAEKSVLMKNGDPVPREFLLGLEFFSVLISLLVVYVIFKLFMSLEFIAKKEKVFTLKASLNSIQYGVHQNGSSIPFLVVNGISLKNISKFNPNAFVPGQTYFFYYTSENKFLLSIETLNSEE